MDPGMTSALRLMDPEKVTVVADGTVEAPAIGGNSGVYATAPQGVRVLVVDDNPTVRRLVRRALVKIGFHVDTAEDAGPALAVIAAKKPDIAIVDLGMPSSGLDLVRQIKLEHGSSIHVTVLSGHAEESARVLSFDAGADDYLVKPMSTMELQRRMAAAARKQHAFVEARKAHEHADRLRAYSAEAAALLAHDLNNGLAIGVSNLSYLSEVLALDEDQRQALDSTLRALTRMSGLVANFVDIARFEDEALKPNVERGSIHELLAEVVGMHTPPASKNIRMDLVCDPAMVGLFDHALILRVLHNLVGNATRYCQPGGVVTVAATPWESADHATGVELTVANTGPQVPPEVAGNLFSKYARGKNGKRGMGLYFCRLACEAHGGTIGLESSPTGPAFKVRLPGPST
jgi:two-component system sensor histidine kinase/response regulator